MINFVIWGRGLELDSQQRVPTELVARHGRAPRLGVLLAVDPHRHLEPSNNMNTILSYVVREHPADMGGNSNQRKPASKQRSKFHKRTPQKEKPKAQAKVISDI